MDNISLTDTVTLTDMLNEYIIKYAKMIDEGATDKEFTACERIIDILQIELYRRKIYNQLDDISMFFDFE